MAELTYFKAYLDLIEVLEPLNDTERGRLFTAALKYARTGEVGHLCGNERYLFPMLKAQIDRDKAGYDDFVKKQTENGKKGGRPKKPPHLEQNHENPKNPTVFLKTQKSQDKDKDKEKEKEKDKIKSATQTTHARAREKFTPPTLDEVKAYFIERQNGIDAQQFHAFYSANGWVQGKARKPIIDWKQCVITWERNQQDGCKTKNQNGASWQNTDDLYGDIGF